MQYKNISENDLTVPTALGDVVVKPKGTVLTAPKHAAFYIKAGVLEPTPASKAVSKSRRNSEESDS